MAKVALSKLRKKRVSKSTKAAVAKVRTKKSQNPEYGARDKIVKMASSTYTHVDEALDQVRQIVSVGIYATGKEFEVGLVPPGRTLPEFLKTATTLRQALVGCLTAWRDAAK